MRIEKALERDLPQINAMIMEEFPYVERSYDKLLDGIRDGNIVIFKAQEEKQVLGFIELEFLEIGIARINGLAVDESARNIGIGKNLLEYAIEFLKSKGIERILLLVKQSNEKAKALYKSRGFEFIGLYHRRVDSAAVEEMELDLSEERPAYVS